jgi:hypothetical protein
MHVNWKNGFMGYKSKFGAPIDVDTGEDEDKDEAERDLEENEKDAEEVEVAKRRFCRRGSQEKMTMTRRWGRR